MDSISSNIDEAIKLFSGTLVVGNHDSITLFGIDPQNKLKDYSRRVASLLLRESEDLDMAIAEVLIEIDRFESTAKTTSNLFFLKKQRQQALTREYNKVIGYIENMTVFFKLQQAQLLKEIKLLEKLANTVSHCSEELEICIKTGKSFLANRASYCFESGCSPPITADESELKKWYERLEKRIEDLAISHVVSLQSIEQIKLLYNNDLLLLDRIASTISNTFPIWQNQIAIMIGVDLFEKRMKSQESVSKKGMMQPHQTGRKTKKETQDEMNMGKVIELNRSLASTLTEITKIEKNDALLRETIIVEAR